MRGRGTEIWAGVAMLVVSIGVAAPALLVADPLTIPGLWWTAIFLCFLGGLIVATASGRRSLRYAALVVAVVSVWALVLTAQSTGILLILLVVAAATSVYVVPLWCGLVLIVLNTAVIAIIAVLTDRDVVEGGILTGFYLLIQLATLLSTTALIREQTARRELAAAHVRVQAASVLLSESARTTERLRISRDLHDLIGHQLTVLTLELETARHLDGVEARAHTERANDVARGLLRDVRATVGRLRTEAPDLESALRDMTDALPGLNVIIDVAPEVRVGERETTALIRATQEIVTNTLRHAEARELRITVSTDADSVTLRARDDGRGTSPVRFGNGLLGLRERFEELDGALWVDSASGFEVTVRVPA
ncbi:sensor histidine kinase [Microbacterium gorillae]|uniref:sensor histidine kinase n=1 Tax=Microbacterium gorillae TaxID=1231063 RepID=UPI003D963E9E